MLNPLYFSQTQGGVMEKYSRAERLEHLQNWRDAGISGKAYCLENDIKPSTFYSWIKLEKQRTEKKAAPTTAHGFVKIPLSPEKPAGNVHINSGSIAFELRGLSFAIPLAHIESVLPQLLLIAKDHL
jgi:transposase-like protein